MMKQRFNATGLGRYGAGIALAAWMVSAGASDAAAAQRLRLGTIVPKGSSYYNHLMQMGQEWRKAPDGGAQLTVYPDGRMGGEEEMIRRIRNGQLQAGLLTTVGISKIEPAVAGLQSMPMMFRSLEEVDYIGRILQPELERSLADKGFVVLFWTDTGWIRFFSSEPVLYPDDLRRLKIWSWAGNPAQVDIYKKAGFTPVPLETKDIVLSFQTKAVSAIPMPATPAMASQLDELAPHMLNLKWAPLIGAAIVDKDAWEKLSSRDRAHMLKSAAEAGQLMKDDGRQEAKESVEAMVKRGLTVHEVTPEIEDKWREAAQSAYPEIRGRLVPEEVVDRVQRLLAEYRSKNNPAP